MATNVNDLVHEQEQLAKTKVHLFNPTTSDFTVNYHGQPVTIHSQEIETFDYFVGQHVKKHLANHLLNKRGISKPDEDDYEKVYKQIVMEL